MSKLWWFIWNHVTIEKWTFYKKFDFLENTLLYFKEYSPEKEKNLKIKLKNLRYRIYVNGNEKTWFILKSKSKLTYANYRFVNIK